MGNFETSVYNSGLWSGNEAVDGWQLRLSVHDSDIATIDYRPHEGASGRFYLGFQPRDYFENPDASEPVDLVAESERFSAWVTEVAGLAVPAEELRAFMAVEAVEEPEDTFVEDTVVRLLGRLSIPLPEWLAG
ncbi:hypothetical protein [Paenarthrobacter sp. YJN-5]|uniref:hypothetical protein n=1 Tax=Paenarthrobacter sp. YJN-5 TaxID=2735316 RepID=UPI001877B505|nr:hypothetical protein [Paenarthrobacter sp. YJN-5]QOT19318.1 hypothetical protein HMI59_21925 [Paenarthrobacter sp. YJN-5]